MLNAAMRPPTILFLNSIALLFAGNYCMLLFEHVSKQRTFGSIFREMRLQLSRRLLMNFLTLY